MKTLNIPNGYNQVMPYLTVKNASAFIEFSKSVFGAEEKTKVMRDDTLIMHGELAFGSSVIMFADSTEQNQSQSAVLFLYVVDCDSTYKNALDHGATTVTQPADQSYGRSAGIMDPFGNTWWITSVD